MRNGPSALLALLALCGFVAGCKQGSEIGKVFQLPQREASKVFGVSDLSEAAITNQNGIPVPGVILREACLIEDAAELSRSKHKRYVIFEGFVLGEGARSRFWQQQSGKVVGLGLPDFDTEPSKVLLVEVDTNNIVISSRTIRASHVTLGVDTNEFSRSYKPK